MKKRVWGQLKITEIWYSRLGFARKEMPEHIIALGEDPNTYVYMELAKA